MWHPEKDGEEGGGGEVECGPLRSEERETDSAQRGKKCEMDKLDRRQDIYAFGIQYGGFGILIGTDDNVIIQQRESRGKRKGDWFQRAGVHVEHSHITKITTDIANRSI